MFHGEVVKLISNQRRKGRPRDVCKGRLKIKLILKRLTEKNFFSNLGSLFTRVCVIVDINTKY